MLRRTEYLYVGKVEDTYEHNVMYEWEIDRSDE